MLKSIKKGVGLASRKAADYVGERVKGEIEGKVSSYKKRFNLILWEQTLFIFGFVLISLGAIQFFSRTYSTELIFVVAGIIILIIGYFVKKIS
ncbi:MAG: hypothetical protein KJ718_02260 [Nanoarchaeota archaeon]|nr:hypothetical protein [Nanoarchaeota archaeon]